MLNFAESWHLVFRPRSALERGEWKSKGKGVESIHFNGSDEAIELILRTVISVNQLCVYGAVADLWKELINQRLIRCRETRREWELESMVIPTEFLIANFVSHTDAEVQRKLLRQYEQKFAELLEQPKLTELCSNAFFRRILTKDNSSLHLMKKDLTIWKHHVEGTFYCEMRKHPAGEGGFVETRKWAQSWMWRSAIIKDVDRTVSWVRIVNGIDNVAEIWEEILVASLENEVQGNLSKAKPRSKPALTLSLVSILYRERKRIDVDRGKFSQGCFNVSKFMIRLLRHDTVHREDDGAVRFDDLAEKFKAKFDGTSQWSIEACNFFLATRGGPNKRFQYCLNPCSSRHF